MTSTPVAGSGSDVDRHQPVIDFDHHSYEYWIDIDGYVDRARQTARVGWSPHHGGFWLITRAAEARWVAQHPELFSSGRFGAPEGHINFTIPSQPVGKPPILEELDPPEHGKYRRMVNVTLSPREVRRLRPNIQHGVTFMIDRFIERGACDLVQDYTSPTPALITVDLLGFPTDDWPKYSDAFHGTAGYAHTEEEWREAAELARWVDAQCVAMAETRRRQPSDDVASRWLAYEVDGAPVATDRVAMLLWHLLGGGTETTGSLVASVLKYLFENPQHKRRLIEDPELLDTATEEFIRFFPPAKGHARVVVEDVELNGCQMRKGDKVLLSWVSVNRDEEVFGSDSTTLVLDRFPNRHASFSYGPHRCPGSHLARETFKEMISQVLTRLPAYEILSDQVTRFPDQSMLGGFSSMPAVFPPGARVGNN
jgi:cytochrome P450